ncbi:MAG TPA: diguanylate cyclase [Rudaea sp.]|jgi:diguanylate cyclase (GGDEF)-like protein
MTLASSFVREHSGILLLRDITHLIENADTTPLPVRSGISAGLVLLFAALATILSAVGLRVWQTTDRFVSDNNRVSHSYEVEGQVSEVLADLGTLQADAIGYAVTGDQLRLARFNGQLPLLDNDLKELANLVQDNPVQVGHVGEFTRSVLQQRDAAVATVDARLNSGTLPPTISDLGINAVRGMSRTVLDEEDKLLHQRHVATERTSNATQVLTTIAIVFSLVFLAIAYGLVAAATRRSVRGHAELRDANAQLGAALAETRRIGESMQKLGQLGEMLQSCRELDEVRAGLGGALGDLLPQLGGRLALINPSQNLAAIGAHWGRHALLAESIFSPEDCWALRRGQAYPLAGTSAGFVCKHIELPSDDYPDAGYLCVPLAAQGEVIGVLTFDGPNQPSAAERRIALAAGEQLALALANLRLQESLRTQSIRDPLTGLFNRRYLEVSLEREVMRAVRRSQPLAVLMLDIDHFKRFNDSHGHDAGDALLSKFAEVLQRSVRNEDIACRYGGEEFTVVMLEADAKVAERCAEQIREAVAAMSVEHRREQLPHVTVSIGYAAHPHDARNADELLRRADAALYLAKKAGRGRVVAAGDDEASFASA